MHKGVKVAIAIGIVVVLALAVYASIYFSTYNTIVGKKNRVEATWGNVEAAYQRRLDTIPKFVETAKFSVKFQKDLAVMYAEAREGVRQAAASGNPDALQSAANSGVTALLIAVRQEAVPEAKLDQLTELNAEIENIERVVNNERVVYNTVVMEYRNSIQGVPGAWWASGWGFYDTYKTFASEKGAERAPEVNLGG